MLIPSSVEQNYLKICNSSLLLDLEQASRQNFYFGAKLVRGAYMEQVWEPKLAIQDSSSARAPVLVDLGLECSIICLILLGLMII